MDGTPTTTTETVRSLPAPGASAKDTGRRPARTDGRFSRIRDKSQGRLPSCSIRGGGSRLGVDSSFQPGECSFNVDLMACTASVVRSPLTGGALPFSSQYDCAGSAGTDVFAQDVSIVPGTRDTAVVQCLLHVCAKTCESVED